MLRSIMSTVIGMLAAVLVVLLMQSAGGALFPSSAPYDPQASQAEIAEAIARQPLPALLWSALGDTVGATAGVFVAAYYARPNRLPALIVAAFLLIGISSNVASLPYPLWLSALSIGAIAFGALTGFGLAVGRGKKPAAPR